LSRQDFYYLQLAQQLLGHSSYELISMKADASELWFQSSHRKDKSIVRIVRRNFKSAVEQQKDVLYALQRAENMRKQRGKSTLTLNTIYFADFDPFYTEQSLESAPSPSKVNSYVEQLTAEKASAYEPLFERLGLTLESADNFSSEEEAQRVEQWKHKIVLFVQKKQSEEQQIAGYGKPIFTYIFLAMQILMFLFLEWKSSTQNTLTLIQYGAKYNPLIMEGEWWRFFTPIILHIGLLHLLMNSVALYYLGTLVERIYGSGRFVFIYIFAGFAGSLGSFIWNTSISAGASGAIFGCFGALLFLARTNPRFFFRTMGSSFIVIIVINLIFGFVAPNVDNAGHIGGLVGGFLAASIVSLPKQKKLYIQIPAFICTLLLVGSLLFYGYHERSVYQDEPYALSVAATYLQQKQYEEAKDAIKLFVEKGTGNSNVYFVSANAEFYLENYKEAKQQLNQAVKYDSTFHEAYYNLALVNMKLNDIPAATQNIDKAIALEPQNEKYEKLKQEIGN